MTSREQTRAPASDEDEIDTIVRGFLAQQARTAADEGRPSRRGTHAKGVCVRAAFEVPDIAAGRDRALARRLAVGVFARPGCYSAIVRFANSDPTVNSDWQPDVRGLSFSVELPLAASAEWHGHARQDWSLQSAPTLPFNDVHAFAVFGKVLSARNETVGLAALSAEDQRLFAVTKAAVVRQQRQQPLRPYQQLRYWSNVPFRHGSQDIVKYSASPVITNAARALDVANPQALRDELLRHVNEDETMSAFEFGVQFLDPRRMRFERRQRDAAFWIENASIEWPEREAPFHAVARLTLLRRGGIVDDTCERMFIDVNEFCLPEHAPVGGVNRARRAAELASRRARGAR